MAVQIDRMKSEVEILPSRDAGGGGGPSQPRSMAGSAVQSVDELKEVLRPIVLELLTEELESYRRMRG